MTHICIYERWPDAKCPYLRNADNRDDWTCKRTGEEIKVEDVGVCQWGFGFWRWTMRHPVESMGFFSLREKQREDETFSRKEKPDDSGPVARLGATYTPASREIAPGQYVVGYELEVTAGMVTPSKDASTLTEFIKAIPGEWTEAEAFVMTTLMQVIQEGREGDKEYLDGLLLEKYDAETIQDAITSVGKAFPDNPL